MHGKGQNYETLCDLSSRRNSRARHDLVGRVGVRDEDVPSLVCIRSRTALSGLKERLKIAAGKRGQLPIDPDRALHSSFT